MATKAEHRDVALSDNARVVLERRYLAKDEHGRVVETPEQLFQRVAAQHRRRGGRLRRRATGRRLGEALPRRHDQPPLPAQLADARERRPAAATARRLLRPARRGLDGGHLRRHSRHGDHPQERRRHRLLLRPSAPRRRHGAEHGRTRQRARLLHEGLRRRHRGDQAGRHATRRQHGNPERRAPGHRGVHPRQGGHGDAHQLQHLRLRQRAVHGGGGARRGVLAGQPAHAPGRRASAAPARSSAASSRTPGATATPASSSSTA